MSDDLTNPGDYTPGTGDDGPLSSVPDFQSDQNGGFGSGS
jgi:hypothetical protein